MAMSPCPIHGGCRCDRGNGRICAGRVLHWTYNPCEGKSLVNRSPRTLPVSVIIPSRDRPGMLRECVASILAGSAVPRELIVVDQSSGENNALAEMGITNGCVVHYRRSAPGVSAARNEACALAGEDIVAFTDDDILVARDWLGAMVRAVNTDPAGALITGRVLPIDTHAVGGFAPSLIEDEQPRIYEGRIWTDVLYSNNMAFARSIFDRLGPFDARLGLGRPYPSAADNDYGLRALEAGYRIRYVPDAIVYHQAWRPKKSYPRLQWTYGVGQGAYLTKHVRLRDPYTLIRLRNEVVEHFKLALQARARGRLFAMGEAAQVLGLVYGSARWALAERLRGR
jgi:GT2 family glycosyltransferase